MNFIEKIFKKVTNTYVFEQILILRGGAEIVCKGDFEKDTEVFIKSPDGLVPIKDDLWDLDNGYSFRTVGNKIVEIFEPKKEDDMKKFEIKEIKFETEEEKVFISECIKGVMDAGEAGDEEQAYAICKTKYDEKLAEVPEVVVEPETEVEVEPTETEKSEDLQIKVDTLTEEVKVLNEKMLKIEEMIGGFSRQDAFEKFQTEINDRITKIDGSKAFEKIEIEDKSTDYERFLNKYKK